MSKYQDFKDQVIVAAAELAKEIFGDFVADAEADAAMIVKDLQNDIIKWSLSLSRGEITEEQFDSLVRARVRAIKLHALAVKAIAEIKLLNFLNKLIDNIVKIAIDTLI